MFGYVAALNTERDHLVGRKGWAKLAGEERIELRQPPSGEREALLDFLGGAAGLWINHPAFLTDNFGRDLIHDAVRRGKRCFVEVRSFVDECNSLLVAYGLHATTLALHDRSPPDGYRPREIVIARASYPGAFHDPVLFDGVESVLVEHAHVLICSGHGRPVLTVPLSRIDVVERQTDLFERLEATAVSVMGSGGDAGRLLAVTGHLFGDPPPNHGAPRLGIDANRNLARNLLRWLVGAEADRALESSVEAFRLIDHAERAFVRYLRGTLSSVHSDWWTDGVPRHVRIACATRAEEERNQLEKHCYLDLIHLKEIASENWEHVESDFRRVGWGGNKKAALKWLDRLNEIRKLVMHPTKRAFGETISAEDLQFLRDLRALVEVLVATNATTRGGDHVG